MPSPVDPSRRTALVRALNQSEMFFTAYAVSTRGITDLAEIASRLVEHGGFSRRCEQLAEAIKAGEYGPYQETDESGAAV